jgi:integrase
MVRFNPKNERIKRAYFRYLREADQKADSTIRGIEKAILRMEHHTGFANFGSYNSTQAVAFKIALAGDGLSKATIHSTVNALKRFLKWLACQPGYKSKIHLPDIEYLNLSEKDVRAAKEPRYRDFPTVEQIHHVVASMPSVTETQRRDRALIAFTALTGMRDGAIASLRLKHVDLDRRLVKQDPREVRTKFSKRIDTYFFPVGGEFEEIVLEWMRFLRSEKLFGHDDPLFPRTAVGHDEDAAFVVQGVEPVFWETASPIRAVFRQAFETAGLEYFSPHTFRHTLTHLGERLCRTPEQFKAWSQNLGHEQVLTTFNSYGKVSTHRQGELVRAVGQAGEGLPGMEEIVVMLQETVRRERLVNAAGGSDGGGSGGSGVGGGK